MSFVYDRKRITLENYKEVFGVCSADVLDEIRSAVMDDTPIGNYIDICGDDNYLLGQIRMAIRECIPAQYILSCVSANTMKCIRRIYSSYGDSGYLMHILKYVKTNETGVPTLTISKSTFESIVDLVYLGVNISVVDFEKVTEDAVSLFCSGLIRGLPMWLLYGVKTEKLEVLMRGMQLGVDVHRFIEDSGWDNSKLYTLFSYARQVDLNKFLSYVNSKFDSDMLVLLLDLAAKKEDYTCLTPTDKEGYPLYSYVQMNILCPLIYVGKYEDIMPCYNLSPLKLEELVESRLNP